MKNKIIVILLAALLVGCFSACAQQTVSKPVTAEGAIFGGRSDDRIRTSVVFDPAWLTGKDSSTYNPELAQFCALLCADSYFRAKDCEKQTQNRVLFDGSDASDYDLTSFLTNVGFTQAEHFESYLVQESPEDPNDSVTLTAGHQTVGGKYDVYAVVVRGCFSVPEWCSAFDPGSGSAAYAELTGGHPEWTNAEHFKGADVAANRALSFLSDFMERTGDASLPDRLLITGHSRGGGIANLLGAHFEKDANVISRTYTFNALSVTLAADAKKYSTIFNIYDSGDFFTDAFTFASGPFVRYGKDKGVSVSASEKLLGKLAALTGRSDYTSVSAETAEEFRGLFAQRFPDRDMLYDPVTVRRTFAAAEEAQASRDECLQVIGSEAGLGLEDLCSVSESEKAPDGSFSYTLEYSGAALLRTYGMLLAFGDPAYAPAVSLFAEDELGCRIAALLHENAAEISGGHLLINSYVIAGDLK